MAKRTFEQLVQLMTTLRGPQGCPWDRKQTLATLKPFVIEESYEVVDAIDRNDRKGRKEELGDFLLQAVFIAVSIPLPVVVLGVVVVVPARVHDPFVNGSK